MTPSPHLSKSRRQRLDHERYMRQRDDRLKRQHAAYWEDPEKYRHRRRMSYRRTIGLI